MELAGIKRDQVVRIYIDKEGGVTIEDCTNVSNAVETLLDVEDFIPGKIRPRGFQSRDRASALSVADFVKFAGQLAKVKTKTDIDGQKTFVGAITAVDGDEITIDDRTRGYGDIPARERRKGESEDGPRKGISQQIAASRES